MGGIIVEPEGLTILHRLQGPLRGDDVEGDLCWVHLEGEAHVHLVEYVQNGIPQLREFLETLLDRLGAHGWEGVKEWPDGTPGEAVHHLDPHVGGRPGGPLHLLGCTGTHAIRISVPPYVGWEDAPVAVVHHVRHGLAGQVVADGPYSEAVGVQQLPALPAVARVLRTSCHVEVVTPARQLESVVSPFGRLGAQFLEG